MSLIGNISSASSVSLDGYSAGGDLSGTYPNPTVIGLDGYALPVPSGSSTVLTYNAGALSWTVPVGFTAGGDLSGTSTSQTVAKLDGYVLPTPAAPAVGVLQTSGTALSWGTVNLASSSYVTGVLPVGNQANQTVGGDLSGTTAAATLVKIDGYSLPNPGNQSGVLTTANGTLTWTAPTTYVSLSGDLGNTNATPYVESISGASPIAITPSVLNFTKGTSSPTIKQLIQTTDTATNNLTLRAQDAYASAATNTAGGNLLLQSGVGTTAAGDGLVICQVGSTNHTAFGYTSGGSTTFSIYMGTTIAGITSTNYTLQSNSASTTLNCPSSGGNIYFYVAGTQKGNFNGSAGGLNLYTFLNFVSNTTANQTISCTGAGADTATAPLTITGEAAYYAATSNPTGGALKLQSGFGSVATGYAALANAGAVQIQPGGTTAIQWDGYGEVITSTSVAITSSNVTLTPAQCANPYIALTGTMSGSLTVKFAPTVASNTVRHWKVDISAIVFSSNTLTLSIGTGATTVSLTTLTTNSNIIDVYATTSNILLANI